MIFRKFIEFFHIFFQEILNKITMKLSVLFYLTTIFYINNYVYGALINVLLNVQQSNFTNGPENFGINQVELFFLIINILGKSLL